MALKKYFPAPKKRSGDSGVEPDRSLLSREQRHQRLSLFLQDFDHQDLKEEEAAATVVAAVTANDCSVGDGPNPKLVRTGSKRVKVTTIVEYEDGKEESRSQGKKTSQKIFKTKSLASLASAFKGKHGASRSVSSTPNVRGPDKPCMLERSASAPKCTPVGYKRIPQRGLSKSASETGCGATLRSASMPHEKAVPFVNIPLADGQTLCSAGDDLQNINVDLLNDDTVQHIHTLVSQLTVLCGKATGKPS
ncbi:borealin-2-like isoform X3 [Eublepharis macularius]|uniref:Borealin-2-like isoform X3 n=1 Tax=Eublepharis macularius TaxID=481883 RepID=A0AA97KID6_EUBMA|nr:borealin-2-like isoform X3 [Eublepharis macularius]